MRTIKCGIFKKKYFQKTCTLCGWVQNIRNLGNMLFIQLKDRYGISQIVFHSEILKKFPLIMKIKKEFCIQVTGTVQKKKMLKKN
ncbi:OB-fold nucleic acid binding domain-containing protein [Buchnera aphidicola]|uniref:OB-fold nucleic acid binding domain-containing protein n=1 Tax=Buchnera aphidicola TaxID=9 RepID=UPI0031B6A2E6